MPVTKHPFSSSKHAGDSSSATLRRRQPPQEHTQTSPRTATMSTDHHNNNDNHNKLQATTVYLSHRWQPLKIGSPPLTLLITTTEQNNILLAIKTQSTATLTTTGHRNHCESIGRPTNVADHHRRRHTETTEKLCTQHHKHKKTTSYHHKSQTNFYFIHHSAIDNHIDEVDGSSKRLPSTSTILQTERNRTKKMAKQGIQFIFLFFFLKKKIPRL
jgi:hypothetical protein